ncbi:MAG: hypothetical protein IAF02_17580 [Anaerolineae bacterium]|nr:hypothetical protein [Anaerolineae bacterium]
MPQLHFYVPETVAKKIKERALAYGVSTSKYLAELVQQDLDISSWPEGFFDEVVGGWQGEPLQRPEQGVYEIRDTLQVNLEE